MRAINQGLAWLSARYLGGVPTDNVAIVAGVLLTYVLGHAFQRIPPRMAGARHAFSVASTVLAYGVVQDHMVGLAHLAAAAVVVYLLIRALPGVHMPRAVFAVAMLHMSYSHVRRQMHERVSGRVEQDYTGAQMIFVIKATSLANCIYDGRRADPERMTPYQRRNAIARPPGFLEFLGYMAFYPSFAVGPAFELAAYRRMMALDSRRVAGPLARRAYARLAQGAFWMAVYLLCKDAFTFAELARPGFYAQRSLGSAALYLCAAGVVARAAYYTAWKMSEGACVLAGLGFGGLDESGSPQWLDIANVHVRGVELGANIKTMVDSWNIGTNTWLRHHVYLRVIPQPVSGARASSTPATLLTFLVSAWWHGFYPGYYLTFVLGALAASAARVLRRNLRPLVAPPPPPPPPDGQPATTPAPTPAAKRVYDVAAWALAKYSLDFVAAPFMLLALQPSLLMWRYNYYAVPLGVLAVFAAFGALDLARRPHPSAKRQK
ncbi:Lysophospholipid acyltransferase [Coemansia javaensis]|uniref:Lysophospholipid acyltransferase n=1 Tax=Coemansia javaensis TaxID=2761396 RepID=A0A9W8HBA9_9FUNG|nr:Lysophospholipid acyltransferase [Coemansia javaensis]